MEFSFDARVVVTMDHKNGSKTSSHVATDFNLDVSSNLERSQYLDEDDLPTKEGSRTLTLTLVQGLIGNIHFSESKGYKNSATHLREIITELEKGFASVASVKQSNFK